MNGRPRSPYADALGKKPPERISEYFDFTRWPEKAAYKVTRMELLAILEQVEKGKRAHQLRRRFWRWLTSSLSWKATEATPPTQGEIARGEGTPAGGRPQ